jgi:hypothetical protein
VQVSDVKFDQARSAPGEVAKTDTGQKPPVFDPCDFKVTVADIQKIEAYLKDAKAVKEWLQKIRKWLPKAKDKEDEDGPQEIPQKYLDYLTARAATPKSPRILAKRVLLDKVQIPWRFFGSSEVKLENLSDSARVAALPVKAALKSYDTPASASIVFDYSSPDKGPSVSGTFAGIGLSELQNSLSRNAGLVFKKGTASGKFEGTVTSELIDLAVDIDIRDLDAAAQGDGILGLDPKVTSEALAALDNLHTTIRIVGPVSEPRLAFDVKGLQEEFKTALVKAGKERLAKEIDKQIQEHLPEALGDKVPGELGDVLKKPGDLIKGLGGLLGRDKDKKE